MLQSHLADAMVRKHLSDAGEADFLFEIGWVDHGVRVLGRKGIQKSPNAAFGLIIDMSFRGFYRHRYAHLKVRYDMPIKSEEILQAQLIHVAVVLQ